MPNPANRALYDELYGVWCELYPATRDLVHEIGEIGGREQPALGAGEPAP
jgi:xylulokinase